MNRIFLSNAVCSLSIILTSNTVEADEKHKRPLVVAHRGLLLDAPENTLANFRACLELGLGFELDVQRSKDGQLVCVHDDTVDRTTNGTGKVTELTLDQLKALDAGSWFSSNFRGERIPTLAEVFKVVADFKKADVLIAVDLKGDDSKIEADCVEIAEESEVLDRLLFIGRTIANEDVRRRLRQASDKSHIACVANTSAEFSKALADAHADWFYVRYLPSDDEVRQVHAAGKQMFIAGSTVAGLEPGNWQAVARRGVDAILTDYSIELARQIRANSRRQSRD